MSNALAITNSAFPTAQDFQVMKDIAVYAVSSGLLPSSVNTKEKALIIVMKSRALGIDPMHGLWSISVINNKPCMSAELMLAVGLKNVPGFKYDFIETDNTKCVIEASRPGGRPTRFSFTIEDAKRAGIHKNVWLTYPAAMCRARAISAMCRALIPDALAGVVYTPEELGANVDGEGNLVRDVTPPEDPPPSKQPTPKEQTIQAEKVAAKVEEIRKEIEVPQASSVVAREPHRDPNAFVSSGEHVIRMAKKNWEGRTIRDVVDEIGLPEFMNDVRWWSEKSGRKDFREIKELRARAEDFELELHMNHSNEENIDEVRARINRDFENESFEGLFPKGAVK